MTTLRNKRVLVTGAGGFIGSHLCEKLVQGGAKVRALLRYTSHQSIGNLKWLTPESQKSLELVRGDLRDEASVRRAVKGCEWVFHLGAIISVPYSFVSPVEYVSTNLLGTAHILQSAKEEEVSRVVHTSTSEVFGTAQYVPMDEAHPLCAQSPYAASKIGADKLAESFYRTYNLPVVILRPFNTFGPRQSLRAVVPTIISQALDGNDIVLGSLAPKRDLTFVQDTVNAFIAAAQSPKAKGEFINVGTGDTWSVREIVKKVEVLLGKKLNVISSPERVRPNQSEVLRLQCNPQKAKRVLGWEAETTLDEALRQTFDWISAHQNELRPTDYHV